MDSLECLDAAALYSETAEPTYCPSGGQNQAALQEMNSGDGLNLSESAETSGKNHPDSRANDQCRTNEQCLSQPLNEVQPQEPVSTATQSHEKLPDVEDLCSSEGSTREVPNTTNLQDNGDHLQAEQVSVVETEVAVTGNECSDLTKTGDDGKETQPETMSDEALSTVSSSVVMDTPKETSPSSNTDLLSALISLSADIAHSDTATSSSTGVTSVGTATSHSSGVVPPTASLISETDVTTGHADIQQSSIGLAEEIVDAMSEEREDMQRSLSPYILVEQDGMQRRVLIPAAFESPGLMYAREEKSDGIKMREVGLPPAESATEALHDDSVVVEEQGKHCQDRPMEAGNNEDIDSPLTAGVGELSSSPSPVPYHALHLPGLRPIDPTFFTDLEAEATKLGQQLEDLLTYLRKSLHGMSVCTMKSISLQQETLQNWHEAVDSAVKDSYTFLAKFDNLTSQVKPIQELGSQINQLNETLKVLEKLF